MVSFAKEFYRIGFKVVIIGKGKYDYLYSSLPFEFVTPSTDKSWFIPERIKKMMNMDQYGNNYASTKEIEDIVKNELEILNQYKVDVVITGYRTTLSLSCRIAHIPLVWILSAVVSPMYYEQDMASMPERVPVNFIKNLESKELQNYYYSKLALSNNQSSKNWNSVLKKYGQPLLKYDLQLFEGDFNLMSDAPELFKGLKSDRSNYQFCGPIFNSEIIPMPDSVKKYRKGKKKIIFFSMGSSGEASIFLRVLDYLNELPYDVFVATTSILDDSDIAKYSGRFIFEKKYPPVEMSEFADLSIIHGGQGTVYSTILAGSPYVGLPMFSEQQYNLENISRFNCGRQINIGDLNFETFQSTLADVLGNKKYKDNIIELRSEILRYYKNPECSAVKIGTQKILKYFSIVS